jgi:hypothetical protein
LSAIAFHERNRENFQREDVVVGLLRSPPLRA